MLDLLEAEIQLRSTRSNIVGQGLDRLPNTSCVLTGMEWRKTSYFHGFSRIGISYGSACSNY